MEHPEPFARERGRLIGELRQDTLYAARQLSRSPTFTIVAVLILALGIGANTAIFSLFDSLLFQQLPIAAPEQLRRLEWNSPKPGFVERYDGAASGGYRSAFAYPHFQYMREHARAFSDLIAFSLPSEINVSINDTSQVTKAQLVSGNYFTGLGVPASLGRVLQVDDDRAPAARAAVVSYGFWQTFLGSDPNVIGRSITINGTPFTLVGVTPRTFRGVMPGSAIDVMIPIEMHPIITNEPEALRNRGDWQFLVIGRRRLPTTDDQARTEVETLLQQSVAAAPSPQPYELPRVRLVAGGRGAGLLVEDALPPLIALLGVVILILLIVCANLTGMLRARASGRAREIGMRLALGASRKRLVRQLLTESVFLSVLGGTAGIGMAYALVAVVPSALTMLGTANLSVEVTPNAHVLLFALSLCVLTGVTFGLAPALRATRVDLAPMLKRASEGATARRMGRTLIGVQVALSFVLLVCAGLFVRNLGGLEKTSPGFASENILLFKTAPGLNGLKDGPLLDFYEESLRSIRLVPSVRSATVSYSTILSTSSISYTVPARGSRPGEGREIRVRVQPVAPGYFETMGIRILLGSDITWKDREGSPGVAIINQALAKEFFSDENPVGQQFGLLRQVVGVAANVKHNLSAAPEPTIYVPYRQQAPLNAMLFAVRTVGDPTSVLPNVRRVFTNMDANLPLSEVRTQVAQLAESVSPHRVMAILLTLFGSVSLLLACLGIYGTLSYNALQRTSEIGIRVALGARQSALIRTIAQESLAPVAIGIIVGLAGSLAISHAIAFFIFGVSPNDPVSIVGAAVVLLVAATTAALIPARRASRLDPIKALRHE